MSKLVSGSHPFLPSSLQDPGKHVLAVVFFTPEEINSTTAIDVVAKDNDDQECESFKAILRPDIELVRSNESNMTTVHSSLGILTTVKGLLTKNIIRPLPSSSSTALLSGGYATPLLSVFQATC